MSGRSSYAGLMAPQRPEATTATAPINSTTISPKNHITGPIVPCRSSHPHNRQGFGRASRAGSAPVRAEPVRLATLAGLRVVRLSHVARSGGRGLLSGGVGPLTGLDD